MASAQPNTPQITKNFIRIFGAIEIVGGAIAVYFGNGWYVSGLVPMSWFGWFFIAFGAFMEINPERFLQRGSRFHQIAGNLSEKTPPKP